MEEEKMKECLKDLEMNENSTIDDLTMSQHAMINQCLLRKQELVSLKLFLLSQCVSNCLEFFSFAVQTL